MSAAAQIETTFREEHGRILAVLIGQFGDFSLTEDALQDALVEALKRWPEGGMPRNPGAWLTTVARRRAIDRLRQASRLERTITSLEAPAGGEGEEIEMESIPDERLKLMFTCCRPSLALEAQVALTLHTLGRLSTPEIAQRLSRVGSNDGPTVGPGPRQNPSARSSLMASHRPTSCRSACRRFWQ